MNYNCIANLIRDNVQFWVVELQCARALAKMRRLVAVAASHNRQLVANLAMPSVLCARRFEGVVNDALGEG